MVVYDYILGGTGLQVELMLVQIAEHCLTENHAARGRRLKAKEINSTSVFIPCVLPKTCTTRPNIKRKQLRLDVEFWAHALETTSAAQQTLERQSGEPWGAREHTHVRLRFARTHPWS